MNNIDFQEFQEKYGCGNADKYFKNNENVYEDNIIKSKLFTLTDWKRKSEFYIKHFVWDIGEGRFIGKEMLKKQLDKTLVTD